MSFRNDDLPNDKEVNISVIERQESSQMTEEERYDEIEPLSPKGMEKDHLKLKGTKSSIFTPT